MLIYLLIRPIYMSFQNISIRLINGLATLKLRAKVPPPPIIPKDI